MSIKAVRDAFNETAAGEYTTTVATMVYDRAHDTEFQILTFHGRKRDGTPFEATSTKLRRDYDVILGARETAQALLDRDKQIASTPPALPPPETGD